MSSEWASAVSVSSVSYIPSCWMDGKQASAVLDGLTRRVSSVMIDGQQAMPRNARNYRAAVTKRSKDGW